MTTDDNRNENSVNNSNRVIFGVVYFAVFLQLLKKLLLAVCL